MKIHCRVAVPEPCSQEWDAMQPQGCDRFCRACEKQVTDFTMLSDEMFIRHFQQNNSPGCGRFTSRQLSLDIPWFIDRIEKNTGFPIPATGKYLALCLLGLTGIVPTAVGQERQKVMLHIPAYTGGREIKGIVLDEYGAGLPAATVKIKNTLTDTPTDIDGYFTLSVPGDTCTLVVSCLGMCTEEIRISNLDKQITIKLQKGDGPAELELYIDKHTFAGKGIQTWVGRYNTKTTKPVLQDLLLVVDGKPYNGQLTEIRPADIKSITFMKEAEAMALYGSNGKNGALSVTTKKYQPSFWQYLTRHFRKKSTK